VQVFAITDNILIDHVDAVARWKEVVPRLFEPSLAYQYNARSQSGGQTENLNPVVLAALME
jgi:hypothetical protein